MSDSDEIRCGSDRKRPDLQVGLTLLGSGVTNNDSKEYPVESSKSNEFKNNEAQRSTIEDIRTPNNTNNGNYDEIQVKPLLNASQSYIYFYLGISRPAGQDCDRSIIIF